MNEMIYNLLMHVNMNMAIAFLAVAGFLGSLLTWVNKRRLGRGESTGGFWRKRKGAETKPEPAEAKPDKPSFWRRWRGGREQRGRLKGSFQHAKSTLKATFPGRRSLYRLPWFVLLGKSGSGKTSLMRHSGLKLPLGPPKQDPDQGEGPLDWWFFDQAVVLDVKGSLIASDAAAQKLWRRFSALLYQARRERALDGVVLTLRAEELAAEDGPARVALKATVEHVYNQLVLLQKETGISFPVYVVVTHCDQLDGFAELCSQLDPSQRDHVFGWTVPYDPHHQYATAWVDQAFESLRHRLGQIQLETAFRGFHRDGHDVASFFLFPEAMAQLKESLRIALDGVFTPTSYHDPISLRGIYFTGDDDPANKPVAGNGAQEAVPRFVRDLLATRIFPEKSLARPTRHKLKTQNRQVVWLKASTLCASVLLAGGSLWSFGRLANVGATLTTSLNGMHRVLAEKQAGRFDPLWFSHKNNPLFHAMTRFQEDHFSSPFFPASWLSNINHEVDQATTVAFEKILLDGLGQQLQQRAAALTEAQPRKTTVPDENSPLPQTLGDLASFVALEQYSRDLEELQQHINDYNNLRKTLDLDVLRGLIRYCFDFDMPDSGLRHLAAMDIDFQRFGTVTFDRRAEAGARVRILCGYFLDDLFHPSDQLAGDQETLRAVLLQQHRWVDDRAGVLTAMRSVTARLKNTERLLVKEPFGLLREGEPTLGAAWPTVLARFKKNRLLEENMDEVLAGRFRERLFAGRDHLDVPLLEEAVAHKEPMRAFFGLPFIQGGDQLGPVVVRETFEDWRNADLYQALQYHRAYLNYRNEQLGSQGNWAALLDRLALDCLEEAANHLIGRAPLLPMGEGHPFSEKDLIHTIRGFRNAARDLSTLERFYAASGLTQSREAVNAFLSETALALLFRADAFLPRDLYLDLDFSGWDGRGPITHKGLGFDDQRALQAWLNTTRNHLWHIGLNGVAPLLAVLDENNTDPSVADRVLVVRWRGILEEIEAYQQQKPYPAARRLEVFFRRDINRINLENYQRLAAELRPSSNYFLTRINLMKQQLVEHLITVDENRHVVRFPQRRRAFAEGVVEPFNTWLAGAFPFGPAESGDDFDGAVLAQIAAACDRLAPPLIDSINFERDPEAQAPATRAFIQRFQAGYRFLAELEGDRGRNPRRLSLRFRERVVHEDENLGNHIVSWRLRVGAKTVPFQGEAAVADWSINQPIELRLRWAKNAPRQPDPAVRTPSYRVDGSDVVFTFTGRYALLRLLLQQGAAEHALKQGDTRLLRFEIPLQSSSQNPAKAVVFSRLRIEEDGKATLRELPDFPHRAPLGLVRRQGGGPDSERFPEEPVHLGRFGRNNP